MLISAVSVLVVAQSSSEIPEGLMNNPVLATRLPVVDEVSDLLGQLHTRDLRLYNYLKCDSQSSTRTIFCIFRNV